MFKVNYKDIRTTPMVFGHISNLVLVFLFISNTEQVNGFEFKNQNPDTFFEELMDVCRVVCFIEA